MKMSQINAVVAVGEFGSLRAASRHLGIAQPAITRSIREVEHILGVALFDRHPKGARPTPMGTALLRRARTIQSELHHAKEEIEQLKGLSIGTVSATFSTASLIELLPRALAAFRKRYPKGVLKISEGLFQSAEPQILEGALDFYVGPYDKGVSSTPLVVEHLFDNRRYVICRKGHALRGARTLAELADAEWIRPSISLHNSEVDFEEWLQMLGLKNPRVVLHSQSALTTLTAVANSDLLTVLPQQWLEHSGIKSQIESVALDELPYSMPICMAYRRDWSLTPMAGFFCDQVRRIGFHHSKPGHASR